MDDKELMAAALATEGRGQRALLEGNDDEAQPLLREAGELYRQSWQAAGARSFGRLIGMQKAAVLAGDASEAAAYARSELGDEGDSPASWYALAIAALIDGDDDLATRAADGMLEGSDAFGRTARAIVALAAGDAAAYSDELRAIVADFESRDEHLTGVPIADTALMLERFAQARGMAARPESQLLPG